MVVWPKFLPNPSTSFSLSAAPNASRTSMSSGYVRQRPMTSRVAYTSTLTFEVDDGELYAFKAFLAYDLNGGYGWFECPLVTGGGVVKRKVRIISGKYKANYVNYMNWRLTMSVEIKEIGVPTVEYWNILNSSQAPQEGWASLLEALELCVNGRNF